MTESSTGRGAHREQRGWTNRTFPAPVLALLFLLASLLPALALAQDKPAPLRRIAIMPLVNLKPDKDTDWLGKGTAETLTTNLMKVSSLILVEQTQLAAVLYQQDRQIADFADPKTAVKVGKIVRAERVLVGSYAKERQVPRVGASEFTPLGPQPTFRR